MPRRSAAAVMMRLLAWCGIDHGHVVGGEAVARQQVAAGFVHLADGVLEHLAAVLVDVVQALVDGFVGSRQAAAAGGHLEEIAARAVHLADEIDEAQVVFAIAGGLDQHGAGAVAEQDAGGAVGVVDDAAHGIGADDQDLAVRAGGHQVRARGEAVDESGAGGDEIESPGAARANARSAPGRRWRGRSSPA